MVGIANHGGSVAASAVHYGSRGSHRSNTQDPARVRVPCVWTLLVYGIARDGAEASGQRVVFNRPSWEGREFRG